MSYDWEQICKRKTDKELYQIYSGYTILNDEALRYATEELKKRAFDFNNIEKHKKKWLLESLIEEERNKNNTSIFSSSPSKNKSILVSTQIVLALIVVIMLATNAFKRDRSSLILDIIIPLAFALVANIILIYEYYHIKKKDQKRKEKIDKLLKDL